MAGTDILSSLIPPFKIKATASVFILTFIAVKLLTYISKKGKNYPPGPRGVPILGYLPFFGKEPPITFAKMRKIYGDVVKIKMGSWPTIVISGRDTIQEALVTKGDAFSGRPAFSTAKYLNDGRNFAFSAFGAIWKHHRRIVSNVLFAFSNARENPIEDIIRSEAKTVVDELLACNKESISPKDFIQTAASSMVFQLCYGRHHNIRQYKEFVADLRNRRLVAEFTETGSPIDVLPWLGWIMPWKLNPFLDFMRRFVLTRSKLVEEHEATFDEQNLRDIADGLIAAGNSLSDQDKAVGLDKRRIVESLDAVLGAGGATVATTLHWMFLLMAAYPEVQEKVFKEINEVVTQNREPSLSDRKNMPYSEAVILETYRFASPVPFTLPHSTTCDTTLNGYDIEEGTVVLVNLYSVLHDENIWGDPENFRPERFLDSEGQLNRTMADQVIAFSLGRRRCVGEFLARMEVFLFFITLIQRCRLSKPPGTPDYKMSGIYTLSHEPDPFEISISLRD